MVPGHYTVMHVGPEGTLIVPIRRIDGTSLGRGTAAFTAKKNAIFRSIKYLR